MNIVIVGDGKVGATLVEYLSLENHNIVVIDHGQIREQGTHEELLQKEDSVYAALYKTQLK